MTLDPTFIRSCEQEERHLEVRVGNVETESGGRQVFGSVVRAGTDIKVLINRNLDAVGRTGETELTAFTDGCLRQDAAAVRNAITEIWSNGQTEGQINRLKARKRAMYGRAGTILLRARMLPHTLVCDHTD